MRKRIAVIGAGWAGLAAAVEATRRGHAVTVFEAARHLGGRARTLLVEMPGGGAARLDNGQHILIGAYTETLALMQTVGVDPAQVLHAMPLALRTPDGAGLALPPWPAPLDSAWGIAAARGWDWRDKLSLLRTTLRWRRGGFACAAHESVASLCARLRPRVMREFIAPLCVSALNTPPARASGQVFLRVLHDALFGAGWSTWRSSWLLLPRQPLGELFPDAAARWLHARGAQLRSAARVERIAAQAPGWQLAQEHFDGVVVATPAPEAAQLLQDSGLGDGPWLAAAQALGHEPIATVYAASKRRLPAPFLALRSSPGQPAQFVFDRGQLGGPDGLLAFVVSASEGDRQTIEQQVLAQARALGWHEVTPVKTVIEKRATFACTPGLVRPGLQVAEQLWACGDYVEGPYPATIEGAVRSALAAVAAIG